MKITYEYDPVAGHFAMFVDGQRVQFTTMRDLSDERLDFEKRLAAGELTLERGPNRRSSVRTYTYERNPGAAKTGSKGWLLRRAAEGDKPRAYEWALFFPTRKTAEAWRRATYAQYPKRNWDLVLMRAEAAP